MRFGGAGGLCANSPSPLRLMAKAIRLHTPSPKGETGTPLASILTKEVFLDFGRNSRRTQRFRIDAAPA
jgi:hypothetical protein